MASKGQSRRLKSSVRVEKPGACRVSHAMSPVRYEATAMCPRGQQCLRRVRCWKSMPTDCVDALLPSVVSLLAA